MLILRAPRTGLPLTLSLPRLVRFGMLVGGVSVASVVFIILLTTNVPYDAWTYLAAGERLNAGHPLYALSPGDRAVELNPPYWTVPLLSPPLIAVAWRPLALLPGDLGLAAWWSATTLSLGAAVAALATRRPILTLVVATALAYPLITELYVGNVNPLLLAGLIGMWLLVRAGHDGWAGALLGLLVAIKLTPIVLVWWLVIGDRRRAFGGFLLGISAAIALSLLGAGADAHAAYLEVVRHTTSVGQSMLSIPALARGLGVAESFAPWLTVGALAIGGGVAFLLRGRPGPSFAVLLVTMVMASPVVTPGSLTLLFAGLAPLAWSWTPQAPLKASPVPERGWAGV